MRYKVIKTRYNYVDLKMTYNINVGDVVELSGDYFYFNGEKIAVMAYSNVANECFELIE